jgi:hypothetical protein
VRGGGGTPAAAATRGRTLGAAHASSHLSPHAQHVAASDEPEDAFLFLCQGLSVYSLGLRLFHCCVPFACNVSTAVRSRHHALYVGGSNPDQAVIFRQPAHGVGLRVALDEMVVNKFNPRLCPSNFPV